MKRRITLLVLLAFVVAFASPRAARAWNEPGHMAIALMTWRQLDEPARAELAGLLEQHPHYKVYFTQRVPDGVGEAEWAFLRSAAWSDFIRPARPGSDAELFKGPEITRFHRPFWHYIDVPWVHPADQGKLDPTTRATTLPAAEENVLTALEANRKILADRAAPPADRAVAFCWIMHLIGDLHQPLHACSMYSAAYPQGDKGGNDQVVRDNDHVVRLHAYWDQILGTSDAYEALDLLARGIGEDPQLQRPRHPELTSHTTVQSWIDESHRYAIAVAHLNGRLKTARARDYDDKVIAPDAVPPVPHSYNANARDLSRRRAALASYRLADTLTSALGK